MKTNDLKKGTRVQLRTMGWYATIIDNARGNTRLCDVEGFEREMGSVYSHDIIKAYVGSDVAGSWVTVEHTPQQVKLRQTVSGMGF